LNRVEETLQDRIFYNALRYYGVSSTIVEKDIKKVLHQLVGKFIYEEADIDELVKVISKICWFRICLSREDHSTIKSEFKNNTHLITALKAQMEYFECEKSQRIIKILTPKDERFLEACE